MSERDFDAAIEAYREALQSFVRGDPKDVLSHYSQRDDVTLANPLGPPRRGSVEVGRAAEEAAANFQSGSVEFEEVSRYATPDLGYVVQLERSDVQMVGSQDVRRSSLRVTMVFRREEGGWKVAHRHADPITSAQPVTAILES
jgi:ketosteroid isomerase-like protein